MLADPLSAHQRIFGSTFVERLTGTRYAVMRDGKKFFTRHQLVREYGTGNFLAAAKLEGMRKQLKLNSIMDFFDMPPAAIAEMSGLGTTCLYVLICIGEKRGIDIHKWYGGEHTASFDAVKTRFRKLASLPKTDRAKRHEALVQAGTHLLHTAAAATTSTTTSTTTSQPTKVPARGRLAQSA